MFGFGCAFFPREGTMAVITCPHCGTSIEVSDPSAVSDGHAQSGGQRLEWRIAEDGTDIHRCTASD
jgi:hypothetical protein